MTRTIFLVLMVVAIQGYSQINSGQQTSLNNYIDYANQSADEVTQLFNRIKSYYQL